MTNIYVIKYEKETPMFFSPYSKTDIYSILCRNEKEVVKELERLYSKHCLTYPKKLEVQNIWLTEDEIKKLKDL